MVPPLNLLKISRERDKIPSPTYTHPTISKASLHQTQKPSGPWFGPWAGLHQRLPGPSSSDPPQPSSGPPAALLSSLAVLLLPESRQQNNPANSPAIMTGESPRSNGRRQQLPPILCGEWTIAWFVIVCGVPPAGSALRVVLGGNDRS